MQRTVLVAFGFDNHVRLFGTLNIFKVPVVTEHWEPSIPAYLVIIQALL